MAKTSTAKNKDIRRQKHFRPSQGKITFIDSGLIKNVRRSITLCKFYYGYGLLNIGRISLDFLNLNNTI